MKVYRQALQKATLIPVRTLNRHVAADLAAIVEHCLALDTAGRYPSMDAVAEELRRRRQKMPLRARRHTPGYLVRRFVQRNTLATVAALLFIATVSVAFIQVRQQRDVAQARLAQIQFGRGLSQVETDPAASLWLARAAASQPDNELYRKTADIFLRGGPRLLGIHTVGADDQTLLMAPDGSHMVSAGGRTGATLISAGRTRPLDTAGWIATPLAFSPEGQSLLLVMNVGAQPDGTLPRAELRLFDTVSGQVVATRQFDKDVDTADFSPDGKHFVIACGDGAARIFDTVERNIERAVKHDGYIRTVRFDASGRRIASGDAMGTVRVWDVAS